jgi:hypothetical protein
MGKQKFPEMLFVTSEIEDCGKDQWTAYYAEEHLDDSVEGDETKVVATYQLVAVSEVQVEVKYERIVTTKPMKIK